MMTNIEFSVINKSKVLKSNFIIPLAAPLFLLMLPILDGSIGSTLPDDFIGGFFAALIFGAIIWIPTVIFTLIIEGIFITEKTTSQHVGIILLIEGLLAFTIIWAIFGGLDNEFLIALFVSIIIPQILRWRYLKYKNRFHQKVQTNEELDQEEEIS